MGMTPVLAAFVAFLMNVPSGDSPAAAPAVTPAALPSAVLPSASALPAPTASPPMIVSWLGVTIGEAPKDVRSQLGKPRQIVPSSVGDLWRYDVDNGNVTLELVVAQNQVLNIAARIKDGKQSTLADPMGGALGMSAQALQSARGTPLATYDDGASIAYGEATGVRWFYSLDNGAVTGIEISKPLPPAAPAAIFLDASHDGSRVDRAMIVKATTQTDSTNAELAYLHTLQCGNGGSWEVSGQELVPAGGRFFDLFHVTCTTTKAVRDYYFDVTTSYGK
jgi:hypothetical protein